MDDMEMAASPRNRPRTVLERMAELFRAAGDARRLRILAALTGKELCVCELVDALVMPQYEVSRHLARLKRAGLVVDRRDGLWVYYSIPMTVWRDPLLKGFLNMVAKQTTDDFQARGDRARLWERLALRNGDRCVVGFPK
jgi:ArsR family transcriptional regulator